MILSPRDFANAVDMMQEHGDVDETEFDSADGRVRLACLFFASSLALYKTALAHADRIAARFGGNVSLDFVNRSDVHISVRVRMRVEAEGRAA